MVTPTIKVYVDRKEYDRVRNLPESHITKAFGVKWVILGFGWESFEDKYHVEYTQVLPFDYKY